MTTKNPTLWMVEVFVPLLGFEYEFEYYYFDDWAKADQFYRDQTYGAGMRAKPRPVTCFDIIQNPGEMR